MRAPDRRPATIAQVEQRQRVASYALLVIGSIVFLLPFLWMITTSLKTRQNVQQFPPDLFPSEFAWNNYPDGWTALPFTQFFLNSVLVTALAMLGSLISSVMCAYAFARLRSRHKNKLFALLLATMMIPAEVTLVPQFILFANLKMLNTYWPLILPSWLGAPFYIFLLRQFFMAIPRDYDEAALIDGASRLRILWSIILPLSRPGLAAVAIFSFVANWNNFLGPLIYLRSTEKYTMALGLQLFAGQNVTVYNQMMAVSVIALAPIVLVFFLAQRHFIEGVSLSGMGGR